MDSSRLLRAANDRRESRRPRPSPRARSNQCRCASHAGSSGETARVLSERSRASISSRRRRASISVPALLELRAPAFDARVDRRREIDFYGCVRQYDRSDVASGHHDRPPLGDAALCLDHRFAHFGMGGDRRNDRRDLVSDCSFRSGNVSVTAAFTSRASAGPSPGSTPGRNASYASARYIAPVSTKSMPRRPASSCATVVFPDAAGPSIAICKG